MHIFFTRKSTRIYGKLTFWTTVPPENIYPFTEVLPRPIRRLTPCSCLGEDAACQNFMGSHVHVSPVNTLSQTLKFKENFWKIYHLYKSWYINHTFLLNWKLLSRVSWLLSRQFGRIRFYSFGWRMALGESTCRNVPYRVVQFSQSVLKQMTNSLRECSQVKRMVMLVVPLMVFTLRRSVAGTLQYPLG